MSTQISIRNIPTGFQTIISNGRHSILADEPVSSKGTDLGFSPTDLLLASLAMCKVATVRHVARKKGWTIGDVTAALDLHVARGTERTLQTTVTVAIDIEGELDEWQRRELLTEADACYIHRMIEGAWEIEGATELAPQPVVT